jgi:hypothetical protein
LPASRPKFGRPRWQYRSRDMAAGYDRTRRCSRFNVCADDVVVTVQRPA